MKSSELLVVVDSVEEAVRFYTEKLAFDIIDLQLNKENPNTLLAAHLRKGKCFILFRIPAIEELAEFSFIKRCASRCIGLHIDMKKGLDKYYERCLKKGLKIISEPKDMADGTRNFSLRDPFGIKLIFSQLQEGKKFTTSPDLLGLHIDPKRKDENQINDMVDHLRKFSVLRRAAKKYSKLKLKQLAPKTK